MSAGRNLDTPNARKILELSRGGKWPKEIALELGLSVGYVSLVKWRARKAGVELPEDPKRRFVRRQGPGEGNERWRALDDR